MSAAAFGGVALVMAALSTTIFGCAFLGKSDSVVLRYFSPETVGPAPGPAGEAQATPATGLSLRIGRVNAPPRT